MFGCVAFSTTHIAYGIAAVNRNAIDDVAAYKPTPITFICIYNNIAVSIEALIAMPPAYRIRVAL